MKLLYQIHNVGIFLNDANDEKWNALVRTNIKEQFDGFEIFTDCCPIEYRVIIDNPRTLPNDDEIIVVPECSEFYLNNNIFKSNLLKVAYQIRDKEVVVWTDNETWYIPFLVEFMFNKQGIGFIHGAGVVSNNDSGKLILAFGGIGKTCFIANAAKKDNITILGDDLILVSKKGELLSYPRPFCLYEYHQKLFPEYFKTHKVKYKTIKETQYFRRFIRRTKQFLKIKDKHIYYFLPVSPVHLFSSDKIAKKPVKLDDIYILRRNRNVNEIKVNTIDDSKKAAIFALDVIMHEYDIGLKATINRYAQNFENIIEFINERKEILDHAFSNAKHIFIVEIPEHMSAEEVSIGLCKALL